MKKDFDKWNKVKKEVQEKEIAPYAHAREVWWCSLGLNIGAETDGKNHSFERPVLVLRVYNKETLLVLPITSLEKDNKFHFGIDTEKGKAWIKLTQVRVVSSRRLLRKVDMIKKDVFVKIKDAFEKFT